MKNFILEQFQDEVTGLNFGTDRLGNTHLLEFLNNAAEAPLPKDSVYLKAFAESRWADTINFHYIPCNLTGDPNPMIYQVPPNKTLHLDTIIAATNGRWTNGMSLVGVFTDDTLVSFFPIVDQLFYSFNEKLKVVGKLELKFRPYHRRTKLSLFIHGLLL